MSYFWGGVLGRSYPHFAEYVNDSDFREGGEYASKGGGGTGSLKGRGGGFWERMAGRGSSFSSCWTESSLGRRSSFGSCWTESSLGRRIPNSASLSISNGLIRFGTTVAEALGAVGWKGGAVVLSCFREGGRVFCITAVGVGNIRSWLLPISSEVARLRLAGAVPSFSSCST